MFHSLFGQVKKRFHLCRWSIFNITGIQSYRLACAEAETTRMSVRGWFKTLKRLRLRNRKIYVNLLSSEMCSFILREYHARVLRKYVMGREFW